MKNIVSSAPEWHTFSTQEQLSEYQKNQFQSYADLLVEWSQKISITTITDPSSIVLDHFQDSVYVTHFLDFTHVRGIADIGSGGGFPGIPLAIFFPEKPLYLIEVNEKKIAFLHEVVRRLSLNNVTIYPFDWRTFLRKTAYDIDVFCSRASLPIHELLRVLKPSSPYKESVLVYWASRYWQLEEYERSFFIGEKSYTLGTKKRRYIFFAQHEIAFK